MAPGSVASQGVSAPVTITTTPTTNSRPPAPQLAQNAIGPTPVPAPSATPNATTSTSTSRHAHSTAQLVPLTIVGSGGDDPHAATGDSRPDFDDPQQPTADQPYKDGRIRNPVPSKLKGKTINSSGKFSVMHMDIRAGKDVAADRDAAAKRTSENTALAAKMAYESGYQPHRKSNWLRVPEDGSTTPDPAVPFTGTTPYNHALYGLPKPATNPPKEKSAPPPLTPPPPQSAPHPAPQPTPQPTPAQPARALTAAECKEEQARLLTLLRSLQPVNVVDQLCKALAYFGGVPEAPPPQDGKFPDSAEANGPGSVFVGWIAEIFPDLDSQGRRKARPVRADPDPPPAQTVEKRGRGRPKGSKATKARSDKGVKKGPKRNPLVDALDVNGEHEESWVDVDETVMDNGHDVVITGATEVITGAISGPTRHTPESRPITEAPTQATESGKKRGRPKGSKNRPKDPNAVPELSTPQHTAPLSALFSIGKKSGGKTKGSKKKDTQMANGAWPTVNRTAAIDSVQPQATAPAQVAPMADVHQPQQPDGGEFHLAALKAYNESQPGPPASSFQPVNTSALPAGSSQPFAPPSTAKAPPKKRKRNGKDSDMSSQTVPTGGVANNGGLTSAISPALNQPHVSASIAVTTTPVLAVPPAPPAPKRQKKSKAKAATASAQLQEHALPPAPSHTGPPPLLMPTPETQMAEPTVYTSPTIEELEAQLEQHAHSSLRDPQGTSTQAARPAQQDPMDQSTPHMDLGQTQVHPQQISLSKQVQQAQQKVDQRSMARQRQQQAVARTASPSVNNMRTASPHINAQSASPNMNPAQTASPSLQQQRTNSQTPTSLAAQMQSQHARNTQSYYAQQNTSTQSSYGQQQSQQYTAAQPSPPPTKQQFNVPQSQPQQHSYTASQQSSHNQTYSSQQQPQQQQQAQQQPQQQYSQAKQQAYSTQPQQQYASPVQQQYSAQQRAQQQQQQYSATSAANATQSLPAQSPQYGTSNTSGYHSHEGHFRTNSAASMGFSSYGSNQTSTAAPRNNNLYSTSTTNTYGPSSQQISAYATGNRRSLPTTTSNHTAAVQNVQSLPQNLGFTSDFGNLGFDGSLMSGLDSSAGNHNSLGLNPSAYSMGAGNVSRASGTANNFTSLNNFDSTTLRNDGYNFGLSRR